MISNLLPIIKEHMRVSLTWRLNAKFCGLDVGEFIIVVMSPSCSLEDLMMERNGNPSCVETITDFDIGQLLQIQVLFQVVVYAFLLVVLDV